MNTALGAYLRELIAAEGPISIARYMQLCLLHPTLGYYTTREPFGAAGDFTTAPEISQMFGELLGLWAADTWMRLGSPTPVMLVEVGPGRGTLMADALRAAKAVPAFRAALSVHLVEASPRLRARQEQALAAVDVAVRWHDDLSTVPAGPFVLLANEFLDALPIEQAVRGRNGWHRRLVGFDAGGNLAFVVDPQVVAPRLMPSVPEEASEGAIFEWRDLAWVSEIAARLLRFRGAALLLDYGHAQRAAGETLQAVRAHRFVHPLDAPGESDLTAHVDFGAVGRAARAAGACMHGPATQGQFLRALGIEARAERLKERAGATQRGAIDTAVARLVGEGREAMGSLFKAVALTAPELESLAGF